MAAIPRADRPAMPKIIMETYLPNSDIGLVNKKITFSYNMKYMPGLDMNRLFNIYHMCYSIYIICVNVMLKNTEMTKSFLVTEPTAVSFVRFVITVKTSITNSIF